MTSKPSSSAAFPRLFTAIVLTLGFHLAAFGAAERKTFDVPTGDAVTTLKQAAQQGGVQIMFPAATVQGVKTNAVKGEFAPRDALDRMLDKTGLTVVQDEKTGALAIKRDPSPNGPRVAHEKAATRTGGVEEGKLVLETFEVVGTKVDGLNNKGLLQGGPDAALYHDVVTRTDIERLGVTSMEELFRVLPQTSSPTNSQQEGANNTGFSGGATTRWSTMGLRGFAAGQTVVLINGRALPRTGITNSSGPDLSRIPLAMIERIEILPYAGSAIYGSGAIAGAINIILRKEYTGSDLTLYAGTSTDGGATEYRATYADGRTFNRGRTTMTTTLNYQNREALRASDRDYLQRALQRYGPTSGVRTSSGIPTFEAYMLRALAGAPAVIVVGSSAPATADLGIPGAPGVRYAVVPAGTSAAASFALTPASFSTTAGQIANSPARYGRSVLYEPMQSLSFATQIEHVFVKNQLSAYGEFSVGYNRKKYNAPQSLSVSLSATDPLNPFRTNVTPGFVGRPVTVYLDTVDVRDPLSLFEYDNARAVIGFKGLIGSRWEWTADGVIDYTHQTVTGEDTGSTITLLNALNGSSAGAASAATRRAIYALLADHNAYPNAATDTDRYFRTSRNAGVRGLQSEGNVRLTGDLVNLPAGPLRVSALTKYQAWEFETGQSTEQTDELTQLLSGTTYTPTNSRTANERTLWQNALELSVPIIGPQWRPVPIEAIELQGSASYEQIDTVANATAPSRFQFDRGADSQVIAIKLAPTRDIAFRASYSSAFYPPNWSDVAAAPSSFSSTAASPDAARGNTIQTTPFTIVNGGNLNLRPEKAESLNFGLIFTPRFLKNFSLHADYWKIAKFDAVTRASFFAAWSNPAVYAFAMTRAAPTPEEQALGWLGVVTTFDQRPFNAAKTDTEGVDLRLRYVLETSQLGSFAFNANGSFTNNFLQRISAASVPVNQINAGGVGPLKWRGLGSVTWTKNTWSTTLTGRYVGHYSTPFTAPSTVFPNAQSLDGGRVPAYLHWGWQVSHEVPLSTSHRGWRNWVAGTKWTVGASNIFNEKPAFTTGLSGVLDTGASFYNSYDDPRQRYVYVQVRKSL